MKNSEKGEFPSTLTPVGNRAVFRHLLTSRAGGQHYDCWNIDYSDLPLETTAPWSVRKYTLSGGRQQGVDVIEVNNGCLSFWVVPSRGMSILKVQCGDVRLGWDSPVREVVNPQYIDLARRGGLGWLEGFNEWLVRCGLEWAGHPGRDTFRNNLGDEVEMDLTLHGRIGNLPAVEVELVIESGPLPRLYLRGLVEERMFHGPQLSLWAEISTELGSNAVRIKDLVTNNGCHDQEFQVIYHANFGPPLLEAGSQFLGAVRHVFPFNAHAARTIDDYHKYTAPQTGFIEQVYCLEPLADAAGNGLIMLQNAKADRAVSLAFPVAQLPSFTLWKNLAGTAEGYVTGLEPGTGFPYTRRRERAAGRVPKLAPQATREFLLEVSIHPDHDSVQVAQDRVKSIQGSLVPVVESCAPLI